MPKEDRLRTISEQRKEQNRLAQRRFRERAKAKVRNARQQGEHDCDRRDSDATEHDERRLIDRRFGSATSSPESTASSTTTTVSVPRNVAAHIQAFIAAAQSLTNGNGQKNGLRMLLLPNLKFLQGIYANAARMGIPASHIDDYWYISAIGKGWNAWQSRRAAGKGNGIVQPSSTIAALQGLAVLHASAREEESARLTLCAKQARTKRCEPPEETDAYKLWTWDHVAPNMRPTPIQMTIEHHPYIDVGYPWPSVRDKILLLMDSELFTEEGLCQQTASAQQYFGEAAFTIWGDDPSDEMAWEVSESFARHWWFLFDRRVLRRTNWWRAQRGVAPIVDDRILEEEPARAGVITDTD